MPGGNGAGSGGILCLDGLQQAGVVIQNCLCRTAAEAEHRGAVEMRGQIFHQLIPVRAAAQLIQHFVELLIQCKDLFLLRPLNVHLPQRHILPQTVPASSVSSTARRCRTSSTSPASMRET